MAVNVGSGPVSAARFLLTVMSFSLLVSSSAHIGYQRSNHLSISDTPRDEEDPQCVPNLEIVASVPFELSSEDIHTHVRKDRQTD